MRVLFDNVFIDGTFSSANESSNYPADNLVHEFLHIRYQHEAATYDTVTVTLAAETAMNCFFYSYTTSTQIVVRFYDSGDVLLRTETFDSIEDDCDSVFFDSIDVKYIEMDVYGGTGTYLGGIAGGEAEDFESPMSPWEEPYIDNSIISSSPFGQTLQQKINPLRAYTWLFRDLTRTEAEEQRDLYYAYGYGARVWIDAFEDDHDFMLPFYGRINGPIQTTKNGRRYDIEWQFREAR